MSTYHDKFVKTFNPLDTENTSIYKSDQFRNLFLYVRLWDTSIPFSFKHHLEQFVILH